MPGPFSAILRGVNRNPDESLTIALVRGDTSYQLPILKTGHRFLILPPVNAQKIQNPEIYPPNCHVLNMPVMFQPDMRIDLIVSFGRTIDWQPLAQFAQRSNCPMVCLDREPPPTLVSPPQVTERQLAALRAMGGERNVFGSHTAARAWGFDGDRDDVTVIHSPVDTDLFSGWEGGDGKVLTVVDGYTHRPEAGFDVWREVTRGLGVNPVGDSPGFSEAAKSGQQLAGFYQRASTFLNTEECRTTPVALMRAMAVGCPIVTRGSPIVEELIENGVNGYVTNDPAEMRSHLEALLADQARARSLGEAARQSAVRLFSEQSFATKWTEVFRDTVDRPACTWMERYVESLAK